MCLYSKIIVQNFVLNIFRYDLIGIYIMLIFIDLRAVLNVANFHITKDSHINIV
jgi:hypothetical protein